MASRIMQIAINCTDAYALAEWWKELLGFVDVPDEPYGPGSVECTIMDPAGHHHLMFLQVETVQDPVGRIHFDIAPDRRREEAIERALALGATEVADHRNPDGTGWMVMADPEGNLFCLLRSDEERQSQ